MTIPNWLVMLRLILTPIVIILLFVEHPYAKISALILFAIAGLTDIIDGILARKLNQKTHFGAFMDPVSDKIMINALLITLMALQVLPLWTILLMITREFIVQVIRDAAKGEGKILKSEWSGKLKADMQGLTIFVGIAVLTFNLPVLYAEIIMYVTLIIAYYALVEFLTKNTATLRKWAGE
jgi:CDP-diacylglycerol--glycerol-3-phosphate 3-phosphatidyltransferase